MTARYDAYLDYLDRNGLEDCQDSWDAFEESASDWQSPFDTRAEQRGEK